MISELKNRYHNLKDCELLQQTAFAAKTEKQATIAFLEYLVEVDERRLYASVNACSSLFQYLTKELGLSEPAASERISAVRLMRSIPEVKAHLETGDLTLTSAAQIQRFVTAEQKVNPKNKSVPLQDKKKVVEACLGKSKREVEKTLFDQMSQPAQILSQEKIRSVNSKRSEIKFSVGDDTLRKLSELKDLIGNKSLEVIFADALEVLLITERRKRGASAKVKIVQNSDSKTNVDAGIVKNVKNIQNNASDLKNSAEETKSCATTTTTTAASDANADSDRRSEIVHKNYVNPSQNCDANFNRPAGFTRKPGQGFAPSRFIPIDLKRLVFSRSQGTCEFIDSLNQLRCSSRFRLQIDHIIPIALGGRTESTNLRHLCSAHNLRLAAQAGLNVQKYRAAPRA